MVCWLSCCWCQADDLARSCYQLAASATLLLYCRLSCRLQVNKAYEKYEKQVKAAKSSGKNTKATQEKILANAQRQQQKRGGKKGQEPVDDAGTSSSNAPQKWSDYSVAFHFPEPTELPPPLMQLIDVDFKYPGMRHLDNGGWSAVCHVRPRSLSFSAALSVHICATLSHPVLLTAQRILAIPASRLMWSYVDAGMSSLLCCYPTALHACLCTQGVTTLVCKTST